MSNEQWTETHRPNSLDALEMKTKDRNEIVDWANQYSEKTPKIEKGLLLSGKPGIGKTSTATAIAGTYGYSFIEVNASDLRTKEMLNAVLGPLVKTGSIISSKETPVRRLILIDEIDCLYDNNGRQDSSGANALIKLIKITKNPIILTCNDLYKVPYELQKVCKVMKLNAVGIPTIRKALRNIAKAEGYKVNDSLMEKINASIKKGDMRASIINLQNALQTNSLPVQTDITKLDLFATLEKLFYTMDPLEVEDLLINSEKNPEDLILYIEENMHKHLSGLELMLAYRQLSEADKCLKLARTTNNYTYWDRAARFMTCGFVAARIYPPKEEKYRTFEDIKTETPLQIVKLRGTKTQRKNMNSLSLKIAPLFHCSSDYFKNNIFHFLQKEAMEDQKWLLHLSLRCNLEPSEIAMFLDCSLDDPRIERLYETSKSVMKEMEKKITTEKRRGKSLLSLFAK